MLPQLLLGYGIVAGVSAICDLVARGRYQSEAAALRDEMDRCETRLRATSLANAAEARLAEARSAWVVAESSARAARTYLGKLDADLCALRDAETSLRGKARGNPKARGNSSAEEGELLAAADELREAARILEGEGATLGARTRRLEQAAEERMHDIGDCGAAGREIWFGLLERNHIDRGEEEEWRRSP